MALRLLASTVWPEEANTSAASDPSSRGEAAGARGRLVFTTCLLVFLGCFAAPAQWQRAHAGEPTPPPPAGSLSGKDTDAERTMQGRVDARSHALIVKWLHANRRRDLTLHLDSKGGSVAYGIRLYQAIDAHGHVSTDTGTGQLCLSSCTFLWLAGHTRTIAERAMLGFHSAYCDGSRPCDPTGVGVSNQFILDILARTEPSLAVLVSNTGAMIAGNHIIALASRENGHWTTRIVTPPPTEAQVHATYRPAASAP